MQLLSFLSKVALVCNVLFLFTVVLHFGSFLQDQALISTIVIMGYILAVFVFNPLANISCFVVFLYRKKIADMVPKWLLTTNFIFLFLQITYILLFLNDTVYN